MEGRAVLGRLTWRAATIRESRPETPRAKTLVLDVPGWPGHLPGQHVDLRLTAEDGYQAQRSYSMSAPTDGDAVEITIERVDDGEVSPYLTDEARAGDQFELRGPIGGYFVWDGAADGAVLLVAGGSGLVPLMAILRHHRAIGSPADMRLLLSARALGDVLYKDELDTLDGVSITLTREAPDGWDGFNGRIDAAMLTAVGPPATAAPAVYVCGPTPFVESAAELLVGMGHDPQRVHTERFGPTGG